MTRRSALALLLVAAMLLPFPALAQGNGNGNNGNGNGNNGNGNGNGNNGKGVPSEGGAGDGTSVANTAPTAQDTQLSDDEALAAVDAGRAVSLEIILPDLRRRTGGEIIDAKLQQTGGFLLYALTVLTPDNKVVTEYYYARSGLHVER